MARNKTVPSDTLISLLDEYRFENPGKKIKIPQFGEFIRKRNWDVPDYTIRRDQKLREYMEKLNQQSEEEVRKDLIAYRTLDAEAFLNRYRGRAELLEALVIRDRYYADVAARAVEAIKARETAEEKTAELEEKIRELEGKVAELQERVSNTQARADAAEVKKKDLTIRRMKKLLEEYVYPDAANKILEKEGLLRDVNSIITEEAMEAKTIHADTEITASKHSIVNDLLEGFNE